MNDPVIILYIDGKSPSSGNRVLSQKKKEVEMKYQFPPPLLNSSTISVILIIFVAIIVIIIRDYVQTLNDVCSILSPLSIH